MVILTLDKCTLKRKKVIRAVAASKIGILSTGLGDLVEKKVTVCFQTTDLKNKDRVWENKYP